MPDLDQPAVSEIVVPHFLFSEPGRRMLRVIDRDEAVVIGPARVVDPGVCFRDLMERKIRAGRQGRIVGVDLSDPENPGRRAAVPLGLMPAGFILSGKTATPRQP